MPLRGCGVSDFAGDIVGGAADVGGGVVDFFSSAGESAGESAVQAGDTVAQPVSEVLDTAAAPIDSVIETVAPPLFDVADAAGGAVDSASHVAENVGQTGTDIVSGVSEPIANAAMTSKELDWVGERTSEVLPYVVMYYLGYGAGDAMGLDMMGDAGAGADSEGYGTYTAGNTMDEDAQIFADEPPPDVPQDFPQELPPIPDVPADYFPPDVTPADQVPDFSTAPDAAPVDMFSYDVPPVPEAPAPVDMFAYDENAALWNEVASEWESAQAGSAIANNMIAENAPGLFGEVPGILSDKVFADIEGKLFQYFVGQNSSGAPVLIPHQVSNAPRGSTIQPMPGGSPKPIPIPITTLPGVLQNSAPKSAPATRGTAGPAPRSPLSLESIRDTLTNNVLPLIATGIGIWIGGTK